MKNALMAHVEAKHLKATPPSSMSATSSEITNCAVEGDKERIQVFSGTVIARKGGGISSTTVRRIVNNESVERIFPALAQDRKARCKAQSRVRRAKLYYLRERPASTV